MLVKSVTSYGPKAGLELVTQHSKLIEDFKFNFLDLWIASYSSLSWRKINNKTHHHNWSRFRKDTIGSHSQSAIAFCYGFK